MSSAGLIYKCFGYEIIRNIIWKEISSDFVLDNDLLEFIHEKMYLRFIEEIDAVDNGISAVDSNLPLKYRMSTTLGNRVSQMNPHWNESSSNEIAMEKFENAMNLAGNEFVQCLIDFVKSWLPSRTIVRRAITRRFEIHESGLIIKLEEFCPWIEHLFDMHGEKTILPFPMYILFQDRDQSWRVRAIPKFVSSFECTHPLPEHWRGKSDIELCDLTGIDGCVFVHHTGFIGGNSTLKGALQMSLQSLCNIEN